MLKTFHNKVIAFALLAGSLSPLFASDTKSEQEMRDYLKVHAEAEFSCTYVPLHYIDLKAGIHVIQPIVLNAESGYFFRMLEEEGEIPYLTKLVGAQAAFRVLRADKLGVNFEPKANATEMEILEGMYQIKKILDDSRTGLFIHSSALCPGTVSIGN